jgi:type II secretory pathway pseudopilin PulG
MKARTRLGFSIIELVFVCSLVSLVFLATVMSISQGGYSQTKSERVFTAEMLLSDLVESARQKPYDDLGNSSQSESEKLNGFDFKVQTQTSDVGAGLAAKKMTVTVSWEDRNGEQIRARSFVRPKPR